MLQVNTALLSGCAILGGALILLAGIWFNHYLPVDSALQDIVIASWAHLVHPEREMTLYHLWLISAVMIQWVLVKRFCSRLDRPELFKSLLHIFWAELIVVVVLAIVMFKAFV